MRKHAPPQYPIAIQQAARITELDRSVIERALAAGELANVTRLKRVTLIDPGSLLDWFNAFAALTGERGGER